MMAGGVRSALKPRLPHTAMAVLFALLVTGCGDGIHGLQQRWDAKPTASQQSVAPVVAVETPIALGPAYGVNRGDTLYSVARRANLPVRTIIDANGLQPPYQLYVGQRLAMPRLTTHVVASGDTLYSVARRYQVQMTDIVRANNLQQPYGIRVGQALVVPSAAGAQATIASPTLPTPVSGAGSAQPIIISEASGQTAPRVGEPIVVSQVPGATGPAGPEAGSVIGVSTPPPATSLPAPPSGTGSDVSVRSLVPPPPASGAAVTPVSPPAQPVTSGTATPPVIEPSPGTTQTAALPVPIIAPSVPTVAQPVPSTPALPTPPPKSPEMATPLPAPDIVPEPTPVPEPAVAAPPVLKELAPPPPRGGKSFLWPVRGRLLASFGEQAKGLQNDGINIAAARGTPIQAAENGVVAYAGNELRGFGNLLLIRHSDGYMTAYAHCDTLLVKRGDTVRRGQPVARVGSTGSVTEPQLHFEVRKSGQPVDPERYLGAPGDASLRPDDRIRRPNLG